MFFGVVATGGGSGLQRYQDAFRDGFFVTIGLLVLAFVVGLVDLHQRKSGRAVKS